MEDKEKYLEERNACKDPHLFFCKTCRIRRQLYVFDPKILSSLIYEQYSKFSKKIPFYENFTTQTCFGLCAPLHPKLDFH